MSSPVRNPEESTITRLGKRAAKLFHRRKAPDTLVALNLGHDKDRDHVVSKLGSNKQEVQPSTDEQSAHRNEVPKEISITSGQNIEGTGNSSYTIRNRHEDEKQLAECMNDLLSASQPAISNQAPQTEELDKPEVHRGSLSADLSVLKADVERAPDGATNSVPVVGLEFSKDPDTVRAVERYQKAVARWRDIINVRRDDLGIFQFPELSTIEENPDILVLRDEVNKILESRKHSIRNTAAWSKSKEIVETMFRALSPFAKNFLNISRNAQSVTYLD